MEFRSFRQAEESIYIENNEHANYSKFERLPVCVRP